jgi:hypothetical protein
MILALAYEKPNHVIEQFEMIKQKLKEEHECPKIDMFLNYFNNFFTRSNKNRFFLLKISQHTREFY